LPQELADELRSIVASAQDDLRRLIDDDVAKPRSEGAWSKRQILGHLIDSTAANHQRLVRAQFTDELRFPQYDAPAWVDVQRYDLAKWELLVDLWVSYASHLAHVLAVIPEESLDTPVWVDWYGDLRPISLRAVVDAYFEHVHGHLKQIVESSHT
jgi:hypothetical protein